MIDERPVGASLSRNITRGEVVDSDLEKLISRRHEQRVKAEGERDEEAVWKESTRRYNAARDEEMRRAWCEYHQEQAERHRGVLKSLVAYHETQAEKYLPSSAEAGAA